MVTTIRRDDIQGLRAVGAILVAIYHIWVGRVSGGVDVFFLVSGFLLIGSLGRQLVSTSQIDLVTFGSRLANRILPNALFVVAVILATAWIWIPETRWDETIKQIVASAAYYQNWELAVNSVDYLARDVIGSPLQHYWAMSAQVQSLVLISIVLFVFGIILCKVGKAATYAVTLSALITIFLASLGYSILRTNANQAFTYFDTFARVWEFAAGGVVALVLPQLRFSESIRLILGWVGFVAILACGIVLEVSTIFPGYAALWPVGAAALILVAGSGPTSFGSVTSILSSKPLKWLGDNSYALYLWHWPLLVVYLSVYSQITVGLWEGMIILGSSIWLAHLTTKYVEGSLKSAKPSPIPTFLASAGVVGFICFCSFGWNRIDNANRQEQKNIAFDSIIHRGVLDIVGETYSSGDRQMYPPVLRAKADRSDIYKDGCFQGFLGRELLSCRYGDKNAPKKAILIGSSHAAHWVPAVRYALVEQHKDWKLSTYLKAQCPFTTDPLWGEPAAKESCAGWNDAALQTILKARPDMVILIGTLTKVATSGESEEVPRAFREQWLPILEAGIAVVALRDTPRYGVDVADCISINGRESLRCVRSRTELLAPINPALKLPEAKKMIQIDLSNSFCTSLVCPPVIGNVLVYPDRGHVTRTYMRSIGPRLEALLSPHLDGL